MDSLTHSEREREIRNGAKAIRKGNREEYQWQDAWKLTKPAVYELKKKAEQERLRMHRHG